MPASTYPERCFLGISGHLLPYHQRENTTQPARTTSLRCCRAEQPPCAPPQQALAERVHPDGHSQLPPASSQSQPHLLFWKEQNTFGQPDLQ